MNKSFTVKKMLKGQITFWSAVSHGVLATGSQSLNTAIESDHNDSDVNTSNISHFRRKTKKSSLFI